MSSAGLHQENLKLRKELEALQWEHKVLQAKFDDLKRRHFGPSSERVDSGQFGLALDGVREDEAIAESTPQEPKVVAQHVARKGGGRRPAPENLPIERVVIDVPEAERVGMEKIREDVTEEIDYRPSQFIRRQIVRPVYASKAKDVAPVQALAPKRAIAGSRVGTGLIAHVLVSRFCDHLPYYRLEQIAARQGVALERQKMCFWMEHAAVLLKTVYDQLREEVLKSGYVQVDETPISVLDPDKEGASRKGWLWAYHAPNAGALIFDFNMSRGQESPRAFFGSDWSGVVQTDGYAVYPALFAANSKVEHAGCMAHARRMWVRAMEAGDVDAVALLAEIQKLYQLEAQWKQLGPQERSAQRELKSVKHLANLNLLCQKALTQALPASATGKAASYMLERWPALELFAKPGKGQLLIDNNPVERGIRPTALGRKNWLFIGHPDAGWKTAVLYSVIGSCRLAKINPYDYIVWALEHLAAANSTTIRAVTPLAYKAVKEPR